MRRAEHDIDDVRMPPENRRQRLDDIFDALVRREQAESEQHRLPFHAEDVLVEIRVNERHVDHAMRDEIDLRRVHAVDGLQHVPSALRHDDEAVRERIELFHHRALVGIWLAQDRVQRRHHRLPHFAQESQQMAPRRPAINAELVLHRDDLDVVDVQKLRRAPVGIQLLLLDLERHARRIIVALRPVVHRPHDAMRLGKLRRDGLADVGGECGNAATPRHVVAEKGDVFGIGRMVHGLIAKFRTPQGGSDLRLTRRRRAALNGTPDLGVCAMRGQPASPPPLRSRRRKEAGWMNPTPLATSRSPARFDGVSPAITHQPTDPAGPSFSPGRRRLRCSARSRSRAAGCPSAEFFNSDPDRRGS